MFLDFCIPAPGLTFLKSDLNTPQTGQLVEYCKSDFQNGGPGHRLKESQEDGVEDTCRFPLLFICSFAIHLVLVGSSLVFQLAHRVRAMSLKLQRQERDAPAQATRLDEKCSRFHRYDIA